MRFLLDENLNTLTAETLNVLARSNGDEFRHLLEFAPAGTQDADIPAICHRKRFDGLVTVNHRDFGAKKFLYQALMDSGVHIVVLRPGRVKMTVPNQVSILSRAYPSVCHHIAVCQNERETALVKVTQTSADRRTLDQLIAEIRSGDTRSLP